MLQKIVHILHRVEEGVLAFLLAAMTMVTFSQVVARYVFNTGAVWALELTIFLFAWLVILGISYGIRIRSHIGVDAFVKIFGPRVQRVFALLVIIAGLLYAGLLLYGSWVQTFGVVFMYDIESEDLKIPLWIPLSVLVIGFTLVIIRLLVVAWKIVVSEESGLLIGDEGRDAIEQFAGEGDEENQETPMEPGK